MRIMSKAFDGEKVKLFGVDRTDKEILELFFNREFVSVLSEHTLVSAVAFHLVSEGKLDFNKDVANEVSELISGVVDYLSFSTKSEPSPELIAIYGLFYGLYLDCHNSYSEEEYGGLFEIKLGNLVAYSSVSSIELTNIVKGILLKPEFKAMAKGPQEVGIILRFLIDYINKNLKTGAKKEFEKAVLELLEEQYDITKENAIMNSSLVLGTSLTDIDKLNGVDSRKVFYSNLLLYNLSLEEMFFALSSNYLTMNK